MRPDANAIRRRDFLKSISAASVMLGGMTLTGAVPTTQAAVKKTAQPAWLGAWTPELPNRLSVMTHALAQRSIAGEYGKTMQNAGFNLDQQEIEGLSGNMRYARAAMLVAEKAPLRIMPGEKIVGSATLLEAAQHWTPVAGVPSTSHTTIGFHNVLESGTKGLRERLTQQMVSGTPDPSEPDLWPAMMLCLDAAQVWHQRHLDELDRLASQSQGEERENYLQVRRALAPVPENPPQTFHEAVQSLWFLFAFQRLMGNWPGIGRIDQMLGSYLKNDLKQGRITLDEAREILAHFWIKGTEWTGAVSCFGGSGDAQHYQNIILGGVDAQGREVTNEVTYLVLDIVEELHISDFPIAVRLNSKSPSKLLRRMAQVQRYGGGILAAYNEEVVIEALTQFGYSLQVARTFTNDGCWEVLVPGETAFVYAPFDTLQMLMHALCLEESQEGAQPDYADFESLYQAYTQYLSDQLDAHQLKADDYWKSDNPTPLLSMFVEDCIGKGRSYANRGARYSVLAPHAGGLPNVANSLLVIKKLVYDEQYLSLQEFVEILRKDWEGQEPLRRLILNRVSFYGNDNDEADAMLQRVFNDYTRIAGKVKDREGVLRPAGISTFGREIGWAAPGGPRTASPDGHAKGAILATNFSPSPGTDLEGPTAALKSFCKQDFTQLPNGATLELKVHPESVKGEQGLDALTGLLKSFVRLGGWFVQVDVVDTAMLLDAQRHPEKYPNLSVRVAGWSARFATLDKQWQDMIIGRTQQVI